MVRMLIASSALMISTSALAAPSFPLPMRGFLIDAGLGLIDGTLEGTVSLDDSDGAPPFGGDAELTFLLDYYYETIVGTWSFSGGAFVANIDQASFESAFASVIPASTEVANIELNGVYKRNIRCVQGVVTADVTFYGIPIGNQDVALARLCL